MRIAINGFGRIGKTFLRTLLLDKKAQEKITVAVINIGKGDLDWIAHSFKYDTIMGTFPLPVSMHGNQLHIGSTVIDIIAQLDPHDIKWQDWSVDWVVEATGHFTKREKAMLHIKPAGAQHVLITAPATGADVTIIPGINDKSFDKTRDLLVSLGSCTTNALIPLLKVLDDNFGIVQSAMTTVHAYTNTQVLLDIETDDPRRSRAAALNIIPSTTGVTKVVDKVLPGMGSRFTGMALRVPVAKVSLVDLVFTSQKNLSADLINHAFHEASLGPLKGFLAISREPLVSSDYSANPYSVTVDSLLTTAQATMGKVFGWYDNEWGYCERLKDFLMSI